MSRTYLLIVHPDASIRALMASMLRTLGHRIEEADCDRTAVRLVEASPPSLVLAGVDPGDTEALELLDYLRRKHSSIAVILLFPEPHPDRAREAMRRGAASVLRYPAPANSLRAAVSQALEEQGRSVEAPAFDITRARHPGAPTASNGHHLGDLPVNHAASRNGHHPEPAAVRHSPRPVADRSPAEVSPPSFVGRDPGFRHAVELVASMAASQAPVLIVGERGTGKSLFARALHAQGPRKDGPFVEVACGSIGEAALEAELLGKAGLVGHDRPGKIAQAQGGTLYLDEVSALSPSLQAKLLQWIQDGEYVPHGAIRPVRADIRVVVSTREDLAGLSEEGSFRQDLYHRISVISLKIPPLRHRGADVDLLADHFRLEYAREVGKTVLGFTPEALDAIRAYNWPGNVLELQNAVERGVVLCRSGRIEAGHLALPRRSQPTQSRDRPATSTGPAGLPGGILPLKEALEGPERLLILQALEALNWNRQETARVLDINRTTLYKKMKKYGLLVDEPAWID